MNRLLTLTFFFLTVAAHCQINTLSPYSIYGLGDPSQSSISAQHGMGSTMTAVVNSSNINAQNPATYSDLRWPTFNVDATTQFHTLSNASSRQTNSIGSLQNFSFGFPLLISPKYKRKGGLSFGIAPYTKQGYNIEIDEELADLGTVDYLFKGQGGLNTVYLGGAFDVLSAKRDSGNLHSVSFGANANYLFGHLNQERFTNFQSSASASNLYRMRDLTLSDLDFTIGLLYKKNIIIDKVKDGDKMERTLRLGKSSLATYYRKSKEDRDDDLPILFSFGAYIRPATNVTTFSKALDLTYTDSILTATNADTLNYTQSRGLINTPLSTGIGLSVNIDNKLTIAADVSQWMWSELTILNVNPGLFNSTRASLGMEFVPDLQAYKSYAKTVRFRAGASYEKGVFNVGTSQPERYGINFGIGLPLPSSLSASMFNISAEYAIRNVSGAPLNEQFFNLQFGFTLHPNLKSDQWFYRRKYD